MGLRPGLQTLCLSLPGDPAVGLAGYVGTAPDPALLSFNGPRYNHSQGDGKQLCLYMAPVTLGENSSALGVGIYERFQGIPGYPGETAPGYVCAPIKEGLLGL